MRKKTAVRDATGSNYHSSPDRKTQPESNHWHWDGIRCFEKEEFVET